MNESGDLVNRLFRYRYRPWPQTFRDFGDSAHFQIERELRRAETFGHDLACAKSGTKYCTPEIDTSEIIVDFQWHFQMDFQWHFPTKCNLSVVFSKGLSLCQWIPEDLEGEGLNCSE